LSPSIRITRLRALIASLLALCFLAGTPTLAHAQEDDDGPSGATIVRTRAPKDKRPQLVRNKFFIKKSRIEIAPRFGYISNNALNSEVMLGLGVTYHFTERLGLEVAGDFAFLSGTSNTKSLAIAVLRLLDPSFRLESVDPTAFVTASAIWYPMYGKINPFATAVINLDFFFVFGVGWGMEQVEMLAYEPQESCADPGESSGCTPGTEGRSLGQAPQANHLLVFNFGFGAKVYLAKSVSLRLDGRLYITWDSILNFDEDQAAATNRNLVALANRLTCDDPAITEKACKVVFPTSLVLSAGLGFWAPGDAVARRAAEKKR
jgi:outer membrane beta-barrel protein